MSGAPKYAPNSNGRLIHIAYIKNFFSRFVDDADLSQIVASLNMRAASQKRAKFVVFDGGYQSPAGVEQIGRDGRPLSSRWIASTLHLPIPRMGRSVVLPR
jgi:hypothetical protein